MRIKIFTYPNLNKGIFYGLRSIGFPLTLPMLTNVMSHLKDLTITFVSTTELIGDTKPGANLPATAVHKGTSLH
jgi:hypothetical protein